MDKIRIFGPMLMVALLAAGAVTADEAESKLEQNQAEESVAAALSDYVLDTNRYLPPSLPRPAKGAAFADPNFKTTILRMTDKAVDGYTRDFMVPQYSTQQLDPADSPRTRVMLGSSYLDMYSIVDPGSPGGADAYEYLGTIDPIILRDGVDSEIMFDPNDPNVFFYRHWCTLRKYTFAHGSTPQSDVVVHDFSDMYPNGPAEEPMASGCRRILHGGQGDPSMDYRYWTFQMTYQTNVCTGGGAGGGPRDEEYCEVDSDCYAPSGESGRCPRGPYSGSLCFNDSDCRDGSQVGACLRGDNSGNPCSTDAECPGGSCQLFTCDPFTCNTSADRPLDVITYDKVEDRVLGSYRQKWGPPEAIRWTSSAAKGNRALIKWMQGDVPTYCDDPSYRPCETDAECPGSCIAASPGVQSYSLDFEPSNTIWMDSVARGHSDRAIDMNGDPVMVYEATATIVMDNLVTGKRTYLVETGDNQGTGYHFSGNAYDKPGWVLVSSYADSTLTDDPTASWTTDSLFMVRLDPDADSTRGRPALVWRISHAYDVRESGPEAPQSAYWTEPHANINRAGTHVVWGSNHYDPNGRMETMLAILPENWDTELRNVDPPPPTNNPPTVVLTGTPATSGPAPLTVQFFCNADDPDDDDLIYDWNFGDGTTLDAGQARESHTYAEGGYTARCDVHDGKGGTAAATLVITAGSPASDPPPAPLGLRIKGQ